jgi:tetratricopeptide (TPR) repeat protein
MTMVTALLLALTTLLLPTPAHAEWREATSEHFVVVSEGPPEQLVRFSQRLEALHWLLGQATGVTAPENGARVRITIVDSVSDVHRAMGVRNSNAAGFYRPSAEGAIAVIPRDQGEFSSIILYHEYTHHFMLQYLRNAYPAWYVEGFAELLSTARFNREGEISFGYVAHHRSFELTDLPWTPTARMMAARTTDDDEAGVASYGQYWLVTHYLTFAPERQGQLMNYIRLLNSGQTHEQALSAFPGGTRQLDIDVRNYQRRNRYAYQTVAIPADVMVQPALRVLRPGEAAIVEEVLQAERPMSAADHIPIATRVRAIAARYPDDPAVHILEGRLWRYAQRHTDAEASIDRALALAPDNVQALTLKGQIMLEGRAAANGSFDSDFVNEARRYIVRANRADPDDQRPLIAFFQSFRIIDQPVSDAALNGLYAASRLVPQDSGLRMEVAIELITRRNLPVARQMLAPLALSPHRSGAQAYALKLVEWIDAGGEGDRPEPDAAPAASAEST